MHVELEEVPAGLEERMAHDLPFVIEARHEGGLLVVKISKDGDFRRALSEYLIKQNLVPLRIQEKTLSLEEAFVTITRENIDRFASGEEQR